MSAAAQTLLAGLLDTQQVAELLNLPKSWIYAAAEKGDLPSYKCGKYRRFRRDEIEAWLAKQRNGGK